MELFKQHDLDGNLQRVEGIITFFMEKIAHIETVIEFVATINDQKDCLMSQDNTQDNPGCLWFNIDVPKGHGIKPGDKVRVIIEKL